MEETSLGGLYMERKIIPSMVVLMTELLESKNLAQGINLFLTPDSVSNLQQTSVTFGGDARMDASM